MERKSLDADGHQALNYSNSAAVSTPAAISSNGVASKIQMFGACINDAPIRTLERTHSNSKRQAQNEELLRLLLGCQAETGIVDSSGSEKGCYPGMVQLPQSLMTQAIDGIRELIQDSGLRSKPSLRDSSTEETSINLVKPSAWANRERKYNADLASLRAQIEAKSEAAATAAAELKIMQSGAGMEVLQQRLKESERQAADSAREANELRLKCAELISTNNALTDSMSNGGTADSNARRGTASFIKFNASAGLSRASTGAIPSSHQTMPSAARFDSAGGADESTSGRTSSGGEAETVSYSSNVYIEHLSVSRAKHLFDKNALASAAAAAAAAAIAEQQAGAKRRSAAGRAATMAAIHQAQAQQQNTSLGSVSEQGSVDVKGTDDSSSIEVNSLPWLQQELADTTAQLEQQQADNAILTQQLQQHQQDIASWTQQAAQQDRESAALGQLIGEQQQQIATLAQQLDQQMLTSTTLTQRAEQQTLDAAALTQELQTFHDQVAGLSKQVELTSQEKEALRLQMQQQDLAAAEAVEAAKEQQSHRDTLTMQLEVLQATMDKLRETHHTDLQHALGTMQAQHTALLSSTQELLTQTQRDATESQQRVAQLEQSVGLAGSQASAQQQIDHDTLVQVRQQLQGAVSDNAALRLALSAAEKAAADLSLQDQEVANVRNQDVMTSQAGLNKRLAVSEESLSLIIKEHALLQGQLGHVTVESARVRQQLDQAIADKNASALESATLNADCTSLRLDLQASSVALEGMQASLSVAIKKRSADLTVAAESLKAASDNESRLASEVQHGLCAVRDLQAVLDTANQRVTQLSSLVTAQQQESVSLQKEMQRLQVDLDQARAHLLERETAVEQLETDLVHTRAQSLERDQNALQLHVAAAQQASEQLESQLVAVQQEKQTLWETLQTQRLDWESLQAHLETAHSLAISTAAAAANLQLQSAQLTHAEELQALSNSHAAAVHDAVQSSHNADCANEATLLAAHNASMAEVLSRHGAEIAVMTADARSLQAGLTDAVSHHADSVSQLQLNHQHEMDLKQAQHNIAIQLLKEQHESAAQSLLQRQTETTLQAAEAQASQQQLVQLQEQQLAQLQLCSVQLTAALEEERTKHGIAVVAAQEAFAQVAQGLQFQVSELETKLQQLGGREADSQSQVLAAAAQLQQHSETICNLQTLVDQHEGAMQTLTEQSALSLASLKQEAAVTLAQMQTAGQEHALAQQALEASAAAFKNQAETTASVLQLQVQQLLLAAKEDTHRHSSELNAQQAVSETRLEALKSEYDQRVLQLDQQSCDLRCEREALASANKALQQGVESAVSALAVGRNEAESTLLHITATSAQRCDVLQEELLAAKSELAEANKRHCEKSQAAHAIFSSREAELHAELDAIRSMLELQVAETIADAEEARSALQAELNSRSAVLEAATARLQAQHEAERSELHQREIALVAQAVNQQRELEVEQKKVQQLRLQNTAAAERMGEMHAFIASSAQSQSKAKGGPMAFANFVAGQRQAAARLSSPGTLPPVAPVSGSSGGSKKTYSLSSKSRPAHAQATSTTGSVSPSLPPGAALIVKQSSLSSGGYDAEPAGEEMSGTMSPQTPATQSSMCMDMDDDAWGMTDCSDSDQAALQEVLAAAGAMAKGN